MKDAALGKAPTFLDLRLISRLLLHYP